MRINDPRNVYGEKLLSENEISNTYLSKNTASSTYLSQSSASSTYATKSALTPLATKTEVANTYLSQNDASSTYATKESLNPLATKEEVSAKVDTSSLVNNTIKLTKENTNDVITITSSDVADITNWEIYKITGTLSDGTVISLMADAVISADGLTINLGDGSGRATDIASVDIKLIRENSQGVEEVIPIEVLLSTGLATNNVAMLNMAVDKVIATDDKEQIQGVGA